MGLLGQILVSTRSLIFPLKVFTKSNSDHYDHHWKALSQSIFAFSDCKSCLRKRWSFNLSLRDTCMPHISHVITLPECKESKCRLAVLSSLKNCEQIGHMRDPFGIRPNSGFTDPPTALWFIDPSSAFIDLTLIGGENFDAWKVFTLTKELMWDDSCSNAHQKSSKSTIWKAFTY